MKAAYYERFQSPIRVETLPDPVPGPDDVVIKVAATGICRSDWHGWQGHDTDIRLPHVPGHEFAGIIAACGKNIKRFKTGQRVTVPFCGGCGYCTPCSKGQEQICDNYFQPGFTAWGSFAEYVRIGYADHNLVELPANMAFTTAAVLGCRFITAFRGVTAQGKIKKDDWLAVHGCGGVGLSAIMIAVAIGAQVIAIDVDEEKLKFARTCGAVATIHSKKVSSVPAAVRDIIKTGVTVSIDALGSKETCWNSILSLAKQGRHIQLGLMAGIEANPPIPMATVIANELEIIGSHGMAARHYSTIFELMEKGTLHPELLIQKNVSLEEGIIELMAMDQFKNTGVTIISFP